MRSVLWGSPLPPTRSGVADYAAEVLPVLAAQAGVRILRPPGWTPPGGGAGWLEGAELVPADAPAEASIPLLHLGNNPFHLWIARRLRASGGIVVLHDTVMHHLLVEEAAADGAWGRFAADLKDAHGGAGAAIAEARAWGYQGRLDPFLFPARKAYLRHARGVVVHNRRALRDVEADCPGLPVRRVPLAVARLAGGDRKAWRERLGLGGELLLVHLGFLTPAKGLDTILRAAAALARIGVAVRLLVVGEGAQEGRFRERAAEAGLGRIVRVWGYASQEDLGGILSAADLGLVPRYPTAGETSAAVLRFFAAGCPVAVSGYAQFLELPEAAALPLPPGEGGAAELVRIVGRLAADPAALHDARRAAYAAWEDGGHDPRTAGRALLAAVKELDGDVA